MLRAIAHQIDVSRQQAPEAQLTAGWAVGDPGSARRDPPAPLPGYQILEVTIPEDSPAVGEPLGAITWPPGWAPVSMTRDSRPGHPGPERMVGAGDRISLLAPRLSQAATAAHDALTVQDPGPPPDEAPRGANLTER